MPLPPTVLPGLRSPYETLGGIVHFGRMLDKIRLHRDGKLPPAWVAALGSPKGLDGRCCRFLKIDHASLVRETFKGASDEALLGWSFIRGQKPDDHEIEIWNGFMMKLGWRDALTERLHFRLGEIGQPVGAVLTLFDFIDLDEGRPAKFG